jgi:hypothetical protein
MTQAQYNEMKALIALIEARDVMLGQVLSGLLYGFGIHLGLQVDPIPPEEANPLNSPA